MKRIDLPLDDIIQAYLAGETREHLAQRYGVSIPVIARRLEASGTRRPKRKDLPVTEIVEAYQRGESVLAIARRYNVAALVITRRLSEQNIVRRTRSEQETEKWRQMSAEQRQFQTAAAQTARRGQKVTEVTLIQKAETLQRHGRMTENESQLRDWLAIRGIDTIPQQAIGPYNCDLGSFPVAVEIYGGNWHWHGSHTTRLPKRLHYILNAGWSIIAIHANKMYRPLLPAAADEVATYVQLVRSNPALLGEYRVIRGTGEFVASTRLESDNFATIQTLTRPKYT